MNKRILALIALLGLSACSHSEYTLDSNFSSSILRGGHATGTMNFNFTYNSINSSNIAHATSSMGENFSGTLNHVSNQVYVPSYTYTTSTRRGNTRDNEIPGHNQTEYTTAWTGDMTGDRGTILKCSFTAVDAGSSLVFGALGQCNANNGAIIPVAFREEPIRTQYQVR